MNVINVDVFKSAILPLENLVERRLNNYELLTIYYMFFDSPTDKDFKFIVQKYAQFYQYHPSPLETRLIIDIFQHYGLDHRDLEKAFKLRIQKVLAKARVFPTPSELIVLVKPDAVVNIYDNVDRQDALDSRTTQEIKEAEEQKRFSKFFGKMHE